MFQLCSSPCYFFLLLLLLLLLWWWVFPHLTIDIFSGWNIKIHLFTLKLQSLQVSKQPENSRWQFDFLDWPWHNRRRRSLDFSVFHGGHIFYNSSTKSKTWFICRICLYWCFVYCLHLFCKITVPFRDGLLPLRNISHGCSFWIQEEKSRSRSWSPTGGGLVGSADSKFKVGTMTTGGTMSSL